MTSRYGGQIDHDIVIGVGTYGVTPCVQEKLACAFADGYQLGRCLTIKCHAQGYTAELVPLHIGVLFLSVLFPQAKGNRKQRFPMKGIEGFTAQSRMTIYIRDR